MVITSFYLLDPVIVEFLGRLVWQRQQLQHHLYITTTALLEALQLRDRYTGQHSRRVAEYARRIAAGLGLSLNYQDTLYLAGLPHDVGKVGIKVRRLEDGCSQAGQGRAFSLDQGYMAS